MIEQFCTIIVKELGATGLLVLGLGFIMYKATKELSGPLKIINHEIGEIRDLLREALTKMTK